jgi:23S rRNA (adenine2503-C2)-methyltransferase
VHSRYDVGLDALERLLDDQPAYRVRQVWDGLYKRLLAPEQMTDVPKALRLRLVDALPTALELVTERMSDGGATVKFLWRLHDDRTIETVLMAYRDRVTVCVSSQPWDAGSAPPARRGSNGT